MSPPKNQQQSSGDSGNPPSAKEQRRIADTFQAYARNNKTHADKDGKHNRKIRRWARAGTIGAWIYTFVTTLIFVCYD